ncbi:MAG: peptide-methionine (S)-S-oxide reductase MsrA [Candidatus Paceibacterota bacterium]
MISKNIMETAYFGGGCFWGIEAAFLRVKGVQSVASGYSGGAIENPTYEQVSSGLTGHAETVQIKFDPAVIKYEDLLRIFFLIHDPTTLNRQGVDIGSQYRSIIFYENEEQKKIIEKVIEELSSGDMDKGKKIVTEIEPFAAFYPAEEYHQDYFNKNPGQAPGTCLAKLNKIKENFPEYYI